MAEGAVVRKIVNLRWTKRNCNSRSRKSFGICEKQKCLTIAATVFNFKVGRISWLHLLF